MNDVDQIESTAGLNGGGHLPSTVGRRPLGGLRPPMPDDNDLRRYVGLLREQWLIIAATALAITLAVYVFSLIQPERFESSARLTWTPPVSQNPGQFDSAGLFTLATKIDSPVVLNLAEQSLKMSADNIEKKITVTPSSDQYLLRITATAPTAARAQEIAQTVAEAADRWDGSRLLEELKQKRALLDDQLRKATENNLTADQTATLQLARNEIQTQLESASKDSKFSPSEIDVVRRADLPTSPVAPQPVRNALIGLLAGLLFGCAAAVTRDRLDRRLRTMEDVEAAFHLPVLGVVPKNLAAGRGQRRAGLIDFSDSSRAADSYRTIRTNLTLYGIERGEHRVVIVTSALPAEGKSGAVANIASAFAAAGLRVLAISADLRAPALHQYFDEAFGDSLVDVLSGELRLSAAVRTIEPSAALGNREGVLHLLANDKRFPDPAVLYGSPAMAKLLVEARRRYDVVIIDTPPVLSAGETPLLARAADATIVVTNLEVANRDAARRAMNVLEGAEITPIGLIVTNPPSSSAEHGFGYGYGYGSTA